MDPGPVGAAHGRSDGPGRAAAHLPPDWAGGGAVAAAGASAARAECRRRVRWFNVVLGRVGGAKPARLRQQLVQCQRRRGGLVGSGLAAVLTRVLTPEQVADWGWRLPFLLSIPGGVASWWLRQSIAESPCFTELCQAGKVAQVPLRESLRSDRAAFLTIAGLSLLASIGWYLPWVWLVTWLDDINRPRMPQWEALTSSTSAGTVLTVLTPFCGALSDRI